MSWVRIPLGAFDFFQHLFSLYIDRHIRVDLSDDEQYVRNMPCYTMLLSFNEFTFSFDKEQVKCVSSFEYQGVVVELQHAKLASEAPWVRKIGNPSN